MNEYRVRGGNGETYDLERSAETLSLPTHPVMGSMTPVNPLAKWVCPIMSGVGRARLT